MEEIPLEKPTTKAVKAETTPTRTVEAGPLTYPVSTQCLPETVLSEGRYEVRFARMPETLDELLRLRFEIFNVELGEGLEESWQTCRDRDPFDAVCHHLIVIEKISGQIVGTYRMQTASMAQENHGLYSAVEFDLSSVDDAILADSVEVGRACVAEAHRNTQVLFLLWKGLALYMAHNQLRFLFGCCSLTSQSPEEGQAVLEHLRAHGHMHDEVSIQPQPGFECNVIPENFVSEDSGSEGSGALLPVWNGKVKIPKLFRIYLRHGAKVCGPPAIDREFKTIDYLVLFDVAAMDEKRLRTFFG